MAIVKKRNQQTESRLLLESSEAIELPPASIEERAIIVQFDNIRQFIPELLETLRRGTTAVPVAVMSDDSTFEIHGATRLFWVKLWHAASARTSIDRVQVISCLPARPGVQIVVGDISGNSNSRSTTPVEENEDTED